MHHPRPPVRWWHDRAIAYGAKKGADFMYLNLSLRRTGTILCGLALCAGAIASTGPAALASSSKPQIAATSCSSDNKLNGEKIYSVAITTGGNIQLWYSPTCRTAWAVEINGRAGDFIYVYNENTGQKDTATVPANLQRTVTSAISDAGTQSQACEQTVHAATCTAFF
jgi:hypothetical protein